MPNTPITRFAPSPTGTLHLGAYRTALFSWLYARQNHGSFVIRIEDTDQERSKEQFVDNINDALEWLGMESDARYRQSEHAGRHRDLLEQLIEQDAAYISQEEASGEGERAEVIRFRNPNRELQFEDEVRGTVTFDTSNLGDFVIAKSLTEPLFHLAVVADDHDEGVTHIIRGEDHISNTPRQILIREALGFPQPSYVHIPLILAPDKSKLSKRNGARAISEYRADGFLPDAIVNYMALLGWNPGNEREIFTRDELLEAFSLDRVHKSNAVFDEAKLRHINREHILRLSDEMFDMYIHQHLENAGSGKQCSSEDIRNLRPLLRERIEVLSDVTKALESGELDWYWRAPTFNDPSVITWKDTDTTTAAHHLKEVREIIADVPEDTFTYQKIKDAVWPYADEQGRGEVLWPFRYALSGRDKSPDPFQLASLLGKTETQNRIDAAYDVLQ